MRVMWLFLVLRGLLDFFCINRYVNNSNGVSLPCSKHWQKARQEPAAYTANGSVIHPCLHAPRANAPPVCFGFHFSSIRLVGCHANKKNLMLFFAVALLIIGGWLGQIKLNLPVPPPATDDVAAKKKLEDKPAGKDDRKEADKDGDQAKIYRDRLAASTQVLACIEKGVAPLKITVVPPGVDVTLGNPDDPEYFVLATITSARRRRPQLLDLTEIPKGPIKMAGPFSTNTASPRPLAAHSRRSLSNPPSCCTTIRIRRRQTGPATW